MHGADVYSISRHIQICSIDPVCLAVRKKVECLRKQAKCWINEVIQSVHKLFSEGAKTHLKQICRFRKLSGCFEQEQSSSGNQGLGGHLINTSRSLLCSCF